MLEFKKLEDVLKVKKYFYSSPKNFCNLTLGYMHGWGEGIEAEYAEIDDTLILKVKEGKRRGFYFPIGKDIDGAIKETEKYAKAAGIPLIFTCFDDEDLEYLKSRYPDYSIEYDRDWCDYIYSAEDMATFKGHKFNGQRNHLNKFKKNYPDYRFKVLTEKDGGEIVKFLNEYKKTFYKKGYLARHELKTAYQFLDKIGEFGFVAGGIEVGNELVAFSLGEIKGDTLFIHTEKANKDYEGAYQAIVSEFAGAFTGDKVKYINREEDCGDEGLRTSKMQYHPIELKKKNYFLVKTKFDFLTSPIKIKTERLTLTDIRKSDSETYFKLYTDEELNKYWGYDYKEDITGEPDGEYFYNFQKALKKNKAEYSLAVREGKNMIGEAVLHNFGYDGSVEIGCRIDKNHHNSGYGREAFKALADYALNTLKATKVVAKCYKQNFSSKKMIEKSLFNLTGEDEIYYYFTV